MKLKLGLALVSSLSSAAETQFLGVGMSHVEFCYLWRSTPVVAADVETGQYHCNGRLWLRFRNKICDYLELA